MKISLMKLASSILILTMITGCAPKYTIKYDVTPGEKKITEFDKSKLGVLVFEDNRPKIEIEGDGGSTIVTPDRLYEKPIAGMLTDVMVNHYNANQGARNTIVGIPQSPKEIDLALLEKIRKEGLSDYVLLGSINHYTSNTHDEYYGVRMFWSVVAGLTLWGMILMPVILSGNVEMNSEVELDNVMLVKLDGPQILWKGKSRVIEKKEIALIGQGPKDLIDLHGETTKKSFQSLYNNLMLSSEMGFPQKYSVEDSKKILSYIKINGTLNNLSF